MPERILYVENFLAMPNGASVPVGLYDYKTQQWVAKPNGRVVRISAIVNGVASIDTDNNPSDLDDPLAELGIDVTERTRLAQLYPVGASLWRFSTNHFSVWDLNWAWGPPANAQPPLNPPPTPPSQDQCGGGAAGSIIDCDGQVLRERVSIAGTPYSLYYSSAHQDGGHPVLRIPLVGSALPSGLKRIELEIIVAGRKFSPAIALPSTASLPLDYEFKWDGLDAFGRALRGAQPIQVRIGYTYDGSYQVTERFGYPGNGVALTASRDRFEATLWQEFVVTPPRVDDKLSVSLGGWTISEHHRLDANSGYLHLGDGTDSRSPDLVGLVRVAGGLPATQVAGAEGIPAADTPIGGVGGIAVGPDGTVYYSEPGFGRVRQISPSGLVTTVAGQTPAIPNAVPPYGDNGLGTSASLASPLGLALIARKLYIADSGHNRIRVLDLDTRIISAFAGSGSTSVGLSTDAGSFSTAIINNPGQLVAAPDNSLYVVTSQQNDAVLRLKDGLVTTVALQQTSSWPAPESAGLNSGPNGVAVAPDGTVFISTDGDSPFGDSYNNGAIYKIPPGGSIVRFAGRSSSQISKPKQGDGGPALEAEMVPMQLSWGPDQALYLSDNATGNRIGRVRRINSSGIIETVAGNSPAAPPQLGGGGAPTSVDLCDPWALGWSRTGRLYIGDYNRLTSIDGRRSLFVNARDGEQVFEFDTNGRHLATYNRTTGLLSRAFRYDASGLLVGVSDLPLSEPQRQEMTIERDSDGKAVALVSPYGQRTELGFDDAGMLSTVTDPESGVHSFKYGSGNLLSEFKDPKINAEGGEPYKFEFSNGRLTKDTDPLGHVQSLSYSRRPDSSGWRISLTNQNSHVTTYDTYIKDNASIERFVTPPHQLQTTLRVRRDGGQVYRGPDGKDYSGVRLSPSGQATYWRADNDPVAGMQAPVTTEQLETTSSDGPTRRTQRSRQVSLSDPADPRSVVSVSETTKINGRQYVVSYDAASRTTRTVSPEGREVWTELDSLGRPFLQGTPGIGVTGFSYSATGKLERVSQEDGADYRFDHYAHYASGKGAGYLWYDWHYATGDSADNGTRVVYGRDNNGRASSVTAEDSAYLFSQGWDANGNRTSFGRNSDARSAHQFSFDHLNQMVSSRPQWAETNGPLYGRTFAYRPDRKPDSVASARGVISYRYDTSDRLSTITTPNGVSTFGYYPAGGAADASPGELSTVTGPYGVSIQRTYFGALLKSETWSGTVSGSVSRLYDNDFAVSAESVLSATGVSAVVSRYDDDKLITCASVTTCAQSETNALRLTYDPANGLLKRIEVGQVVENLAYNAYGELASKETVVGNANLLSLVYDGGLAFRDASRRLKRRTERAGNGAVDLYEYSYGQSGFPGVHSVKRNGTTEEIYQYSGGLTQGLGSRTYASVPGRAVIESRDLQYRPVSVGETVFTYTEDGFRRTKTDVGVKSVYEYDLLGNLLAVIRPGLRVDYVVDGLGRRVGRKVNGQLSKQWLYGDALGPVAELDSSGAIVSRFVYASTKRVPDLMIRGGKTYRILSDLLGSPRMIVNVEDGGDVPFQAKYTAFGEARLTLAPGVGGDFIPFGFAGGLYDVDTGLVRLGARDYDAVTGAWTSRDPAAWTRRSLDLYAYAANDPINRVDLSGLSDCVGAVESMVAACVTIFFTPGFFGGVACGYFGVKSSVECGFWPEEHIPPTCNPGAQCCDQATGQPSGPGNGDGGRGGL